jgi:hypothetical protein
MKMSIIKVAPKDLVCRNLHGPTHRPMTLKHEIFAIFVSSDQIQTVIQSSKFRDLKMLLGMKKPVEKCVRKTPIINRVYIFNCKVPNAYIGCRP